MEPLTDERAALAATCVPMARRFALEFSRRHRVDFDQCLSDALLWVCDAARTYRPGVSKFSYHAWTALRLQFSTPGTAGRMRLHLGTLRDPNLVGISLLGDAVPTEAAPEPPPTRQDVEPLLADLKPRERVVVELIYLRGLNTVQCAAALGVSRTRVYQLHRAAVAILRKKNPGRDAGAVP